MRFLHCLGSGCAALHLLLCYNRSKHDCCVSAAGLSLAECLHSGILYLDPANDTVVLRLPKLMLHQLYRTVDAPSYEQLDWGIEVDKGEALERLCWGAPCCCACM